MSPSDSCPATSLRPVDNIDVTRGLSVTGDIKNTFSNKASAQTVAMIMAHRRGQQPRMVREATASAPRKRVNSANSALINSNKRSRYCTAPLLKLGVNPPGLVDPAKLQLRTADDTTSNVFRTSPSSSKRDTDEIDIGLMSMNMTATFLATNDFVLGNTRGSGVVANSRRILGSYISPLSSVSSSLLREHEIRSLTPGLSAAGLSRTVSEMNTLALALSGASTTASSVSSVGDDIVDEMSAVLDTIATSRAKVVATKTVQRPTGAGFSKTVQDSKGSPITNNAIQSFKGVSMNNRIVPSRGSVINNITSSAPEGRGVSYVNQPTRARLNIGYDNVSTSPGPATVLPVGTFVTEVFKTSNFSTEIVLKQTKGAAQPVQSVTLTKLSRPAMNNDRA